MDSDDCHLGMSSPITRRDFLNGVAVGMTGAMALPALAGQADATAASAQAGVAAAPNPAYYPPALTGMRGSHAGSFEVAHARARPPRVDRRRDRHRRTYDLVVVGGGISGLAAAYYFRAAVGPARRCWCSTTTTTSAATPSATSSSYDGRMLVLNGGTLNIESPLRYNRRRGSCSQEIGVDTRSLRQDQRGAIARPLSARWACAAGTSSTRRRWARTSSWRGRPPGRAAARGGFAREYLDMMPLSAAAKADMRAPAGPSAAGLHARAVSAEKKARLATMSLRALPAQGREGGQAVPVVLHDHAAAACSASVPTPFPRCSAGRWACPASPA